MNRLFPQQSYKEEPITYYQNDAAYEDIHNLFLRIVNDTNVTLRRQFTDLHSIRDNAFSITDIKHEE